MNRLIAALALLSALPARAADPAPAAPKGTHFVFLVRHGAYDRDDKADDLTGNPLNALGHEQARLLGARLVATPVAFRSVVTSDYTRARETAADLGAALQLTPVNEPLLRECTPPVERPEQAGKATAEQLAQCDAQLAGLWQRYLAPTSGDTWDVLVAHGNVIRWLIAKATGNDPRKWPGADIANASLSAVAVQPDGSARLVLFSDVGHLPPEQQTWAGRGPGWGKGVGPLLMKK